VRTFIAVRKLTLAALAAIVAIALVLWVMTNPVTVPAAALPPHTPNLDNGHTLFEIGGCASCHATPADDPEKVDRTKLGGGLPLKSPFGTFYAPNISPDPEDGIGAWSEADFVTALTKGTSRRGRHLFPAFPYTSYQHMTLDDARDLFAYLQTLPPVAGRAHRHEIGFPFNIRRLVGLWKLLYFHGGPFVPDPTQSAQWNRGAYLVNGPGHCAECHSPRNHRERALRRRAFAGRQGLRPQHHAHGIAALGKRQHRLVGKGHRELPRRRHESRRRLRGRRHGRSHPQHFATHRRRPRRDRDLHRLAAAAPGAGTAEEEWVIADDACHLSPPRGERSRERSPEGEGASPLD
jgi:mono/diheme cytochrome c family protein